MSKNIKFTITKTNLVIGCVQIDDKDLKSGECIDLSIGEHYLSWFMEGEPSGNMKVLGNDINSSDPSKTVVNIEIKFPDGKIKYAGVYEFNIE